MGQVSASSTVLIDAEPEAAAARSGLPGRAPEVLCPHSAATGARGRAGAGTVAMWKLQSTKSRVRDVKVNVDVAGHTVIEGMPTEDGHQTVAPAGARSSVTVKTSWQGAGGMAVLREDVRAGACGRFRARCWRTSRSSRGPGKRPDIEDRGSRPGGPEL